MGDLDKPNQTSDFDAWEAEAREALGQMEGLKGTEKIRVWGALAAKLARIIIREAQRANQTIYSEDQRLELAAQLAAGLAHSDAGSDEGDVDQLLYQSREMYERAKARGPQGDNEK